MLRWDEGLGVDLLTGERNGKCVGMEKGRESKAADNLGAFIFVLILDHFLASGYGEDHAAHVESGI